MAGSKESIADAVTPTTFDMQATLASVDGDRKLMRELIALFQQTAPMQASMIHSAYQNGDPDAVAETAHQLKGSVSVFGAEAVYNACQDLEQQGRRGDLRGFNDGWLRLQHQLDLLLKELNRLLARG